MATQLFQNLTLSLAKRQSLNRLFVKKKPLQRSLQRLFLCGGENNVMQKKKIFSHLFSKNKQTLQSKFNNKRDEK